MKGKLAKILALSLAATMVSTTMAGCSPNASSSDAGSTTTPTSSGTSSALEDDESKEVELTIFSSLANYQGELKGWGAKILKDRFNVKVNIIAPNVAGGGNTLYQTRSASGFLGDIVMLQQNEIAKTVKAGLFYDMSGMLDTYGKDIKKYDRALKKCQDMYETGDKVFLVPQYCSSSDPTKSSDTIGLMNSLFTRYDYYVGIGSPKIKTTDDIVNMLDAMVKKYPKAENGKKTYGVSLYKDWDYFNMNACSGLGLVYGYTTRNFVEYNNDATKVRSILDKDSYYMQCLRFYYECNKRGLLDPDSPTQNYATVQDKYGKGQILLGWWAYCGLAQYNTSAHQDEGKGFYMIPVEGEKVVSTGFNPYGSGEAAGIGSATKNPVRAMKVLNWLYSPEGVEIINNGPKELCYTEKDGKFVRTEFAKHIVGETEIPEEYGGGTWNSGHLNQINWWAVMSADIDPNTNEPYSSGLWSATMAEPQTKFMDSWIKAYGYNNSMEYATDKNEIAVIPGNNFVAATESDALKTTENQIATVIKQNCWKMAFATSDAEFDSLYNDMVTKANGLGLEEVLKFYKDDTAKLAKAIQESVNG